MQPTVIFLATGIGELELYACYDAAWQAWIENGGEIPPSLLEAVRAENPDANADGLGANPFHNSERLMWAGAALGYVDSVAEAVRRWPGVPISEGWVIF